MGYKKLDDIREELGLPTKGTHKEKVGDYTTIHLHFRLSTDNTKQFLLKCDQLDITEGQFARRAILKELGIKQEGVKRI